MSKRTQLINMIDRYTQSATNLREDIKEQLIKAKKALQQLTDQQFEKMSDHVFSEPANEHSLDEDDPNYILSSLYSEMEKTARDEKDDELLAVMKEMQHFYGITEKDGYFP